MQIKLIWPLVALLLSACAAQQSRSPSVSDSTVPNREGLPPAPTSEVPAPSRGNQAVYDLIRNSQQAYDRGEWESAIAMAERALRIDRRNPEIYLIIAKSYRAMGENPQALEFVEQGLRYTSDPNSHNTRELEWLDKALR